MKKRFILPLLALAAALCVREGASAAGTDWVPAGDLNQTYNLKEVVPVEVTNLDNFLYPSTSQYYIYDGLRGSGKFEIKEPSIMKAYYTWDETGGTKITGQAWFSRDGQGINVIGPVGKIGSASDSATVFLDPGVYYVNHVFNAKQASSSVYTRVGLAVLKQSSGSDETVYASSFQDPNILRVGTARRGFLSDSSPSDYYRFTVEKYSKVTMSYNFEGSGNVSLTKGGCTLYDGDRLKIMSRQFNSGGKAFNQFSVFLSPGTYFVELSGTTACTSVKAEAVSYEVGYRISDDLPTNKPVYLDVLTDFEASEVLVRGGKVPVASLKRSDIWSPRNEGCEDVTGTRFQAAKNGYYSIRVKDADGNYAMTWAKVSNLDAKAPTITGVANGKAYAKGVKIKYGDASGAFAKLNGKKCANGYVVKKAGSYVLKVEDYAGNQKTVKFTVK